MQVTAFNRTKGLALLSDGQTIPVTNWIGADGDECGPADDPVTAVAGPSQDGKWFALALADFDTAPTH